MVRASKASVSVPIWLIFIRIAFAMPVSMPRRSRPMWVVNRSLRSGQDAKGVQELGSVFCGETGLPEYKCDQNAA